MCKVSRALRAYWESRSQGVQYGQCWNEWEAGQWFGLAGDALAWEQGNSPQRMAHIVWIWVTNLYHGCFTLVTLQRTVETELSVFFKIKTNSYRSVSQCMHTHVFTYIYERQKSHGSRNTENKTLLMSAQQPSWEINLIHSRAMFGYFCCKLYFLQKVKGHFQSACTFRSLCFSHWAGSSAAGGVNIQQSIL